MLDPHANGSVLQAGTQLNEARGAVILLHGRGGSAQDILTLSSPLHREGLAYLAPQAAGHTWYPQSFMAQREANEPYLTSALAKVASVVDAIEANGLSRDRIVIAGFSQGACLTSEYAVTHPARYAGLIAFTGGVIGPADMNLEHPGSLNGTPALLLSGDPDPHVPWSRVLETAAEFKRMGADVLARRYPGRVHTISGEELDHARRLLEQAFPATD